MNCRLISLPIKKDDRGVLTVADFGISIPFEVKRAFFMSQVPQGKQRGKHAHYVEEQVLIPVSGRFTIRVSDGTTFETIVLDSPEQGLYIPPLTWTELLDFSEDAVCMALVSTSYNPDDYIYDYQLLQKLRSEKQTYIGMLQRSEHID